MQVPKAPDVMPRYVPSSPLHALWFGRLSGKACCASIFLVPAFCYLVVRIVGAICPDFFLMIPGVGFEFWIMAHQHMPPHIDRSPLLEEHFRKWARDGDVIVSAMQRSGAVLLLSIIHLLSSNGTTTSWEAAQSGHCVEKRDYVGHTLEQRLQEAADVRARDGANMTVWPWHSTFHSGGKTVYNGAELVGLDVRRNPKVKYIALVRNHEEMVRSHYFFINAHTSDYRRLWGGYPPFENRQRIAANILSSERYMSHVKYWWDLHHEPNVLLVHFSDLAKSEKSKEASWRRFFRRHHWIICER
eukprot:gnl/TRDRNA2_/TRDRNA2_157322_c0_seq2.p1 gnl/TRDRNA2_/TRDRNA2_157322_c0~~gnl/TRDRNA2_/TRDRNA2_157322_c0_seq2.p1  ORF type:complete len:301 (+),score=30.46 gnl/TRDRNA2_/TRDRNA2_157322_c0_seq2:120-1022(+)